MGNITDDIIEGRCCALCGEYFVKEKNIDGADVMVLYDHGYSVVCESCWKPDCGYEKAEASTI